MATWSDTTTHEGCNPANGSKGCDLKEFDDRSCSVNGVVAQAEYMKKHEAKLAERRKRFDGVRTNYQQNRAAADAAVKRITKELDEIDKKLCVVDESDRTCLSHAWTTVKAQLDSCPGGKGCCVKAEDQKFTSDLGDSPALPALQAVIAKFEDQVTRAENCFDALAAEPDNLKKHIDDVDALLKKIKDNPDPRTAFAQTLWAKHLVGRVYRGFETPVDFENCLCIALNASLAGRQALAELIGKSAELACKDNGRQTRCTWLERHVVEEIIAICDRERRPASTSG